MTTLLGPEPEPTSTARAVAHCLSCLADRGGDEVAAEAFRLCNPGSVGRKSEEHRLEQIIDGVVVAELTQQGPSDAGRVPPPYRGEGPILACGHVPHQVGVAAPFVGEVSDHGGA